MQLKPAPVRGPLVLLTGPRFPLMGALFSCLIVGHSPGFDCIGPRGASKNIGLAQTKPIIFKVAHSDFWSGASGVSPNHRRVRNSRPCPKFTKPCLVINFLSKIAKVGGKLRAKHTIKPLPKNGFGPPHL